MNSATSNSSQAPAKQTGRPARAAISKQTTRVSRITTPTNSRNNKQMNSSKAGTTTKQQLLQSPTVLPIINAPTSLTNLAQLSGITLLPIPGDTKINSSYQNTISLNPPSISLQPSPNYVTTTTNTNNLKQSLNKPHSNRPSHAIRTTPINQPSVYDLASIPSIHLINQTSATTPPNELLSWRRNINTDLQNQSRSQTTQQSAPKLNGRGGGGRKGKTQCNTSSNLNSSKTSSNKITNHKSKEASVINLNEGLPLLSLAASELLQTSAGSSHEAYDDVIISPPSLDSLEEQHVNINGDMNNISLVKLMAILNNPALTITAVNSNTTNTKPFNQSFSSSSTDKLQPTNSINLLDVPQQYISTPKSVEYLCKNSQSNHFSHSSESIRSRLPQSAANLNLIHKSNIDDISPITKRNLSSTQTSGNKKSNNIYLNNQQSFNLPLNDQREPELQLNWLSALAASNQSSELSTNYGQTSTLSWSKGPINVANLRDDASSPLNSRLTDPTMLSTSVRNLMMQQLPASGSKQPTVSIQLLKHIDDQSKDNNSWPASTNPSQKSIFEPECILSVPQRSIQQLSQTAKRLESSQSVISSCVKKKQQKKPFETSSKSRLYIPRVAESSVDSTGLENQIGLNPISIEGTGEREVALSERHQMLDVMMLDDQERLKKANHVPEPDDIFINRSKRVMSKIDTMVERKRRRRFQRIRDRDPSWKSKKVEELVVESDEEWSSDENVDFDQIGFIKTQLPLEEDETQEKKDFLLSVGLVSRAERNKLSVADCEKKSKLVSPLCLEHTRVVAADVRRFVDIMLKTGGTNVQLRVDSNIKRNDLPLIEGLNRNTSRLKMNYMSALGLEKRSKRTTLYKVKSSQDNSHITVPKQVDLIKVKEVVAEKQSQQQQQTQQQVQADQEHSQKADVSIPMEVLTLDLQTTTKDIASTKVLPMMAFSTSCREAVSPPTKNEYMKSLGLIAS